MTAVPTDTTEVAATSEKLPALHYCWDPSRAWTGSVTSANSGL